MKSGLWAIARTVLPRRQVFDFNQALMDFGATVCVARKPKCLLCPLNKMCRSAGGPLDAPRFPARTPARGGGSPEAG
jgi:A/G-specific adenine glycosylase